MGLAKTTMSGALMFPSNYLSAVEFKGRDVTLTIKGIEREDLVMQGGKKQKNWVMSFSETPKKLVLKPTNSASIASIPGYGTEAMAWIGKRITLYPTKTQFGNKGMVDCIRVRETVPTGKHAGPATETVNKSTGEVEPLSDADIDHAMEQPLSADEEAQAKAF